MKKRTTREEWLVDATSQLRKGLFKQHGYKVPTVKLGLGFPYGSKKAVGQHWHPKASSDKKGLILISPELDEPKAIGTLVHELVHAAVGNEAGHGPIFRRCAIAVGLCGKMRQAMPGPPLKKELADLVREKLGKYPHSVLNVTRGPVKKQTTRMIKMVCEHCGYIARTSMTNIEEHGPVICPTHKTKMAVR